MLEEIEFHAQQRGEPVWAPCPEQAPAAARSRDDNHVGTEHIILGLLLAPRNGARDLLEGAGIGSDRFEEVLDEEAGPSPDGLIPYTTRAMMIGGLAVAVADEMGSTEVNELHLLLGAVAESRRWERQHAWGPHHLRRAADDAGTSLAAIEARAREVLRAG